MRRGDIWFADLDPTRGSEASKVRPVVIVSNDARNRSASRSGRGVLTVVPLTSNTDRILPFQVLVQATAGTGLSRDSKAQAEQVRSIDMKRLTQQVGALNAESTVALDSALLLHLGLD